MPPKHQLLFRIGTLAIAFCAILNAQQASFSTPVRRFGDEHMVRGSLHGARREILYQLSTLLIAAMGIGVELVDARW
jgi:hypothetical protein